MSPVRDAECGHGPNVGHGLCRKCYNAEYTRATVEKRRAYREANAEKIRRDQAAYRKARRAELVAYLREWRKANPDYNREYKEANRAKARAQRVARLDESRKVARRWTAANRDRKAAAANRRRARETEGADLTSAQWRQILAMFAGRCCYCGEVAPLQMEHLVPLSRGGRHTASNVAPACGPCNWSKGTKTAREFAGWDVPPRLSEWSVA